MNRLARLSRHCLGGVGAGTTTGLIAHEVNFDGIVGPTHNFAGLAHGNLASQEHGLSVSHPRRAALQGLAKMKYLADLGLKQAVLPPQERPDLAALRRLGFSGSDADILREVFGRDRRLLSAVYSASSMWAANAATVSPSFDAADGRVHLTPANLITQFHRSLEPPATAAMLSALFRDESVFAHHDPLPAATSYSDEGAANHSRLCERYDAPGLEMFVYGRGDKVQAPQRFPARQSFEACAALARLHALDPTATVFAQQHPKAIDAGVFHNDVVAVANQNVLLYHARAYLDSAAVMREIEGKYRANAGGPLYLIEVREEQVSLTDAIQTYLFNSQLVTMHDGAMALIAPVECGENERVRQFITQLIQGDNPIQSVHYLDVRQSMNNGGGPACLRLRVVLADRELARVHPGVFLTDALYAELVAWVNRHYRPDLAPEDLADPDLAKESRAALDELSGILGLRTTYAFQR